MAVGEDLDGSEGVDLDSGHMTWTSMAGAWVVWTSIVEAVDVAWRSGQQGADVEAVDMASRGRQRRSGRRGVEVNAEEEQASMGVWWGNDSSQG
jgi:hypothetical protein